MRPCSPRIRDRLLEAEVAKEFRARVVGQARAKGWTSDEHFSVDGTLLEAWASVKSFQPKDQKSSSPPDDPGKSHGGLRGKQRSNHTHASKPIPTRFWRAKAQSKEAKLSYSGNLLVERSQRIDGVQHGVGSHGHSRARCGDGHAAGGSGNRAGDRGR